jgi:hypothetical protein
MALRSLEEKAALNDERATRAAARAQDHTASQFRDSAAEAHAAAELVRRLVVELGTATDGAEGRP